MFIRRGQEGEPTRWYRLADSHELFATLHETPNGRPLLPVSGPTTPQTRRYVTMQSAEVLAVWSQRYDSAAHRRPPQQQLVTSAPYPSGETNIRPPGQHHHTYEASQIYQPNMNGGPPLQLLQPLPQHLSCQQPPPPLFQLQQPLPQLRHPPGDAGQLPVEPHRQGISPMRAPAVQVGSNGGQYAMVPRSSSPVSSGAALPWQAKVEPLSAVAPPPPLPLPHPGAAASQGGVGSGWYPAAAGGLMPIGPGDLNTEVVTDSYPKAVVREGLPAAAAVAAVAALEFGGKLQTTVAPSRPAAISSGTDLREIHQSPPPIVWPYYYVNPRPYYHAQASAGYQRAVELQGMQRGPMQLQSPVSAAGHGSTISSLSAGEVVSSLAPDERNISAIQRWLLLLPDHSRSALEKAWLMSMRRATVAVRPLLPGNLGGTAATPLVDPKAQGTTARWDPAVRPLSSLALLAASSSSPSQQPSPPPPSRIPRLLPGVHVLKAPIYATKEAGATLAPELLLQYTNLLYGGDYWDKQQTAQYFTQLPQPAGITPAAAGLKHGSKGRHDDSSAAAQSTTNKSTSTAHYDKHNPAIWVSGTRRLHKMYNQLLGRLGAAVTMPKSTLETSFTSQAPAPKPAADVVRTPAKVQPLARLPYMPDLMAHVANAVSGSNDASFPAQAVQGYIPEADVLKAALATQHAAAILDLQQVPRGTALLGTAPALRPTPQGSNALEEGREKLAARNGSTTLAAGNGSIPVHQQHHRHLQVQNQVPRWRDRQHMESVLAPVFVVDLDSCQVTITYIRSHGRSEMETQTDNRYSSPAEHAAEVDDSSSVDATSHGSQGSAMSSGTDDESKSSGSAAFASDDNMDSQSTSSISADKHSPRATAKDRFLQLLRSMYVFNRWQQRGQSPGGARGGKHPSASSRQKQPSASAGDEDTVDATMDSKAIEGGEDDHTTDPAAAVGGAAASDDGKAPTSNNEDNTSSTAVAAGAPITSRAIVDSMSTIKTTEKETKKKKKHSRRMGISTGAGLKAAADGVRRRSSKLKIAKSKSKAPAPPSVITGGGPDTDAAKKSSAPLELLGPSSVADTEILGGAQLDAEKKAPEEAVDDSAANDDELHKQRSQEGTSSKLHRWFIRSYDFFKKQAPAGGSSQPEDTAAGKGLPTSPAGEQQLPSEQRASLRNDAAAASSRTVPSIIKARMKRFRFMKKVKMAKDMAEVGSEKADNNSDVVDEVKDNTIGDIGARSKKSDGLQAASGEQKDAPAGDNIIAGGQRKAIRTTATAAAAAMGKAWLQSFHNTASQNLFRWLPKTKQHNNVNESSSVDIKAPSESALKLSSRGGGSKESVVVGRQQTRGKAAVLQHVQSRKQDKRNSSDPIVQQGPETVTEDQHAASSGNKGTHSMTMDLTKAHKRKLGGNMFAWLHGRRRHTGAASILQQVPSIIPNNASTGNDLSGADVTPVSGPAAGSSTGSMHSSGMIAAGDHKRVVTAKEADPDDDGRGQQLAATNATGVDVVTAGPVSSNPGSVASLESEGTTTGHGSAQAVKSAAPSNNNEIIADVQNIHRVVESPSTASSGSPTTVGNKQQQVVKGKMEMKKSVKVAKKSSPKTTTTLSAPLPPPQGPKAKLMQKLLKLSDVVNAQRAAATASLLGDGVSRVPATELTAGAAGANTTVTVGTSVKAFGEDDPSLQAESIEKTSLHRARSAKSEASGDLQQQVDAPVAGPSETSVQNKSSALERLKNTLAKSRFTAAEVKVTKVSQRAAYKDEVQGQDNPAVGAARMSVRHVQQGDKAALSQGTSQVVQQQDQVLWGTRGRQGISDLTTGNEVDSSPKPSSTKGTVVERMMASLRRPKHQPAVQEMVIFKEVQQPKVLGMAADIASRLSSPAVSGASSPNSTTRRLMSTTRRAELGASPFAGQVQQAENLMASIRNQQQQHQRSVDQQDDKANPNNFNASGRSVGTIPPSPTGSGGGWTVQSMRSTRTVGGDPRSVPGSPLQQSLLKSTLNKTATIISGQDIQTTAAGGRIDSLSATNMAKHLLTDLGLPPSKW